MSLFVIAVFAVILAASGNSRAAGFDLVMAAVTVAVGSSFRSRTDPGFARRLLFGALALHWLLIGTLQLILLARGHGPLLVADETGYDRVATELSRFWLGHGPVPPNDVYLEGPFVSLLAAAYTAGGYTPFVGLAVPVAFGTWIPVLTHRLMTDYFGTAGPRAARIAALIALLYPATLGWSSLLLKDSSVTFAATAVVIGVLALITRTGSSRDRAVDLGLGLFGIAWLGTNRAAQLVPIAVGVAVLVVVWVMRRPVRVRLAALGAIACAVVAVLAVPQVRHQLDRVPKKLAIHREQGRDRARTAEAPEGPPSQATWLSTAEHVPTGLALVLFRPYPTEAADASQKAGAAGNLVYLIFCVLAAVGVAGAWRAGIRAQTLFLAVIIASAWLVLSVAEGNAGTTWRHRDAVTPLLACLAGIALARSDRAAGMVDAVRRRLSPRRNRLIHPT